jgi:hypothetical protein
MGNAVNPRYSRIVRHGSPSVPGAIDLPGMEVVQMNLYAIETVVRRLFSDAEFRARATVNPSAALEEYHLAADERTALTKLCVQLAADGSVSTKQQLAWW